MNVFDLGEIAPREKAKVLYEANEFNTRVINLSKNDQIPPCEMDSYVLFYVVDGTIDVTVDGEKETLNEKQFLITEPATLSMESEEGAKVLGLQINKR